MSPAFIITEDTATDKQVPCRRQRKHGPLGVAANAIFLLRVCETVRGTRRKGLWRAVHRQQAQEQADAAEELPDEFLKAVVLK